LTEEGKGQKPKTQKDNEPVWWVIFLLVY